MKKQSPTITLKKLAELTGLTFDGSEDDDRLHFDNERITVYAHLMTAKEYKEMEKDIGKKSIKGRGYEISAWNDCSSYAYWKNEGKDGDSNYIQITAYITDIKKIAPHELKVDAQKLMDYFRKYDNIEEYYSYYSYYIQKKETL